MERSSPLAALQPNVPLIWNRHREPSGFDGNFLNPSLGFLAATNTKSFNFKDLSMGKKPKDYFSFGNVRGSSPSTSLAADLSQNFHIDKTPPAPTPRRTLFANTARANASFDGMPLTPPIPVSSPLATPEGMEYSPLPHKPAFVSRLEVPQIELPTPEPTPLLEQSEDISPLSPKQLMPSLSMPMMKNETATNATAAILPEPETQKEPLKLRRPFARPTMRKQFSSSAVPSKLMGTEDSHVPAFMFGARAATSAIPLESLLESPPSERKLPSTDSPSALGSSASKFLFPGTGSPAGGSIAARRSSIVRPARVGLARRTQSMQYGNPSRPMRSEKRTCTADSVCAILEIDDVYAPKLPHFKSEDEQEGLPRITKDTLVKVLRGDHASAVVEPLIIDCRFEYEYEGGHIEGAVNFNDKEKLAKELFESENCRGRTIVFHCEYSAHRAPIMARFIRQRDRAVNQDNYPELTYPEVYILDGGYSSFFQEFRTMCFPQQWVRMDAEEHKNACERGMANVKRRNKLFRAQTYAFGQHAESPVQQDCSPVQTGVSNRPLGLGLSNADNMEVDSPAKCPDTVMGSPNPFAVRSFRRLGSY